MTCKDCIHNDLCEALEMNGLSKVHPKQCGYFADKSRYVELPCKVGDTVYMPWEWNGAKGIACIKVTTMSNILGFGWSVGTDFDTDDEGYADKYKCGHFELNDFGKTVFLTREEAEKALAERKGSE